MHDHPDFPAVQGGMNYSSWNLHLYYLHKNLCNWQANTQQCKFIRTAYNRMLFFVYRQFDLYLKGGAYKWGWVLIAGSIFLFTGRWTYLLRRGGGGGANKRGWGGAYKRGWGGAYKRQLTILYVNHDRGLFITNYNYNYQGRETLTARTISMLCSVLVTTGRDAH